MIGAMLSVLSTWAMVGAAPVLDGYDMVSYFASGTAMKGSSNVSFTLETFGCNGMPGVNPMGSCGNYTFHFANEKNREAFAQDPWKYAPKYGGF
eukprot:m.76110 g.76110  ORF g.76110 m.76110 type:complete len:94 (-) comp12543_c1_seq5:402-683(-)